MKPLYFILSLILSLSLVFSLICLSGCRDSSTYPSESTSAPSTSIAEVIQNIEYSSELDGVYFFGDSTTHGLIKYNSENDGSLGKTLYRIRRECIITPIGGTFYLGNLASARVLYKNERLRIEDAIGKISPEFLIITVGLNGLNYWEKDSFTQYYEAMLDLIVKKSPETNIIIQSVFPIAENRSKDFVRLIPERIPIVNGWIYEICKKYSLTFLDTYSVLADESGFLPDEFHNGDGIHISCEGYNEIMKNIIDSGVIK